MPTYMIGYDIQSKQDETYADMTEAIKELGHWWHPRQSTWVVVSDKLAVQIRDALAPHLRRDD